MNSPLTVAYNNKDPYEDCSHKLPFMIIIKSVRVVCVGGQACSSEGNSCSYEESVLFYIIILYCIIKHYEFCNVQCFSSNYF